MFVMYFSAVFLNHVHATFSLGIEQCSNWRQNLVPDESILRFAWNTYQKPAPEKWSRFMAVFLGRVSKLMTSLTVW